MTAERKIILIPSAQITPRRVLGKCGLKLQAKLTMVISRTMSHKPRFNKNLDKYFFPFLVPTRKAEVPLRNINRGAQKCVIHLVKYRSGVVVFKFSGSSVNACAWK